MTNEGSSSRSKAEGSSETDELLVNHSRPLLLDLNIFKAVAMQSTILDQF
jgi:hypothetical protein